MPRGHSRKEELLPTVLEMRAQGALPNTIAERLDVPPATVRAWLDPRTLEKQKKRRRERYASKCIDCGKLTDGSGGRKNQHFRCSECSHARQHSLRFWTRERIIEAIQLWAEEHGRPPISTEWIRAGERHPARSNVYKTRNTPLNPFDSWADAVEAAGFPRPHVGDYFRTEVHLAFLRRKRIPTEVLVARIKAAAVDGTAPSTHEIRATYNTLWRRGIKWEQACALAGVEPRQREKRVA